MRQSSPRPVLYVNKTAAPDLHWSCPAAEKQILQCATWAPLTNHLEEKNGRFWRSHLAILREIWLTFGINAHMQNSLEGQKVNHLGLTLGKIMEMHCMFFMPLNCHTCHIHCYDLMWYGNLGSFPLNFLPFKTFWANFLAPNLFCPWGTLWCQQVIHIVCPSNENNSYKAPVAWSQNGWRLSKAVIFSL